MKDYEARVSEPENYLKLKENRENALKYAEHIAGLDPAKAPDLKLPSALNSMEDLTSAIKVLDQQKDNKLGIVWHEDDNGNRIRDARNITADDKLIKKDAGEKYAMQVLNVARGGILLLEQSNLSPDKKEEAKARLFMVAESALKDDIEKLPSKIKGYNSALLGVLNQAGIEESADKLNFAKEIANFQDDHKHIITLNSIEDNQGNKHTVIEADVMLNGLTDKQKKQYEAIANSPGDKVTAPSEEHSMRWYNELPEHKRKLIKSTAAEVAKGKKVIPAQLREFVGVRNGYEKTTAVIKTGKDKAKVLSQSLHCGAPASENDNNREEITQDNIQQLKSFTANKSINANILTSENVRDARSETWISKEIESAAKKEQGNSLTYTKSPINRWRFLGAKRDHKPYKDLLNKLEKELPDTQPYTKKYLKDGPSRLGKFFETVTFGAYKSLETKVLGEIATLPEEQRRGLRAAIKARKNLDRASIIGEGENKNLELSANIQIVEYAINSKELVPNSDLAMEINRTVNLCKSGKDRTGLAELKNSHSSVASELDLNEKQAAASFKKIGDGGHTQEMSGTQGGSTGCHSVKMSAEFGLSKADKVLEGIINQKSSGFNSKIKKAKKEKEKVVASSLLENQTSELVTKKQESIAKQETAISQEQHKQHKESYQEVIQEIPLTVRAPDLIKSLSTNVKDKSIRGKLDKTPISVRKFKPITESKKSLDTSVGGRGQ